jgi:hypothetical protein
MAPESTGPAMLRSGNCDQHGVVAANNILSLWSKEASDWRYKKLGSPNAVATGN